MIFPTSGGSIVTLKPIIAQPNNQNWGPINVASLSTGNYSIYAFITVANGSATLTYWSNLTTVNVNANPPAAPAVQIAWDPNMPKYNQPNAGVIQGSGTYGNPQSVTGSIFIALNILGGPSYVSSDLKLSNIQNNGVWNNGNNGPATIQNVQPGGYSVIIYMTVAGLGGNQVCNGFVYQGKI